MALFAMSFGNEFFLEFSQKLFQPLLLFFYAGFLVPILRVPYKFPKQIYQGIVLYLLVAIGWHGGEELARMNSAGFAEAMGFAVIGFLANIVIGLTSYGMLRKITRMRRIDCATVGGYYGSDSAGTFLTCVGVLMVMGFKEMGYMPVLLAVMETPGCLVCLYQVARLRRQGMDAHGNMPDEEGYGTARVHYVEVEDSEDIAQEVETSAVRRTSLAAVAVPSVARVGSLPLTTHANGSAHDGPNGDVVHVCHGKSSPKFSWAILHEVFLNPGLYFLFAGIVIGCVAGKLFIPYKDKADLIKSENLLFVTLMHGILCLFLLEMGITASERLRDLKKAGLGFIVFGILAPNLFAVFGMALAHTYSLCLGRPFPLPTYALFAVLCAAASYIAVPAVQRMAIPEASPTLPLAASLGLTFTWNVTLGIPLYLEMAQLLVKLYPVSGS